VRPSTRTKLTELDATGWELYHVDEDYAENDNLAATHRAKLIEMIATWYVEAGKYNVLPVDSRGTLRFADPRPQIAVARSSYTYYAGTQMVPINAAPSVLNRPHSITADVDIPKEGAEGALLTAGDVQGGFALYVQEGKLQYVYNYVSSRFFHGESNVPVPEGRHQLKLEFEVTGKPDVKSGKGAPGRAQLYIDGKLVGQVDVPLTMPLSLGAGRRLRLRRGRRLAGVGQVQATVQVHGHALPGDGGRERRPHQGQRSGDAPGHGATVGRKTSPTAAHTAAVGREDPPAHASLP
jgi:arylsulfatase